MSKSVNSGMPAWVEIIAAIGVIVSLLFVGFEIRQNTAIARGQARQDLAQLNQEWLILLSQDAGYEALWHQAFVSPDTQELTPGERRRADYIMAVHIRRLENVYLQYREGLVSESALMNYGFARANMLDSAAFRSFWIDRGWRGGFDEEFADFLDSLIQDSGNRN